MPDSLRAAVIKLAHTQPALRKPLLNILREAAVDSPDEFSIWTATPEQLALLDARRKQVEPRLRAQAESLAAAVQAAVRSFFKDDKIITNLRVSPDHTGKDTSVELTGRVYMTFYIESTGLPRDLHFREILKIYNEAVKKVSWKDSLEVVDHSIMWSKANQSMTDLRTMIKIREKKPLKF